MSFDHLPLAHIQDLHAHPALIHRITEHVAVFGVGHRNFLLLHERIDIHDLIAQLFRSFEIQLLRRLLHFALQLFLDFFMAAAEK
ncbi:hypothetical protein D3C77_443040 [compost metagenome]